jgi:hypothetical protein
MALHDFLSRLLADHLAISSIVKPTVPAEYQQHFWLEQGICELSVHLYAIHHVSFRFELYYHAVFFFGPTSIVKLQEAFIPKACGSKPAGFEWRTFILK